MELFHKGFTFSAFFVLLLIPGGIFVGGFLGNVFEWPDKVRAASVVLFAATLALWITLT